MQSVTAESLAFLHGIVRQGSCFCDSDVMPTGGMSLRLQNTQHNVLGVPFSNISVVGNYAGAFAAGAVVFGGKI